MTKRLHACQACEPGDPKREKFSWKRGFTRHKDRVCSRCRSRGVRVEGDVLSVPLDLRVPWGDSEARRPDHYAGRGGW